MKRKAYPTDVNDAEWTFVAPYLSLMTEDAPQREHSLREVFNGLRFLSRSGGAWRLMPHDLPPWAAVYQQTQRWFKAGVFEAIVDDLRALLRVAEVQEGHSIFVPAGQPSYWRGEASDTDERMLHIHLNPELVRQVAETSELDQIDLVNCFFKHDLRLHQIAMLLLSELKSDGIMGQLYVESLTQVLVIHLLRHYSTSTQDSVGAIAH